MLKAAVMSELLTWYTRSLSAFCFRMRACNREPHLKLSARQKLAQPARLFVNRMERRALRSFDGKFKKRTGFGSHPGRRKKADWLRAPQEILAQPARLFVDRLKRRTLRSFDGKIQKADRFWFAPRRRKRQTGCGLRRRSWRNRRGFSSIA